MGTITAQELGGDGDVVSSLHTFFIPGLKKDAKAFDTLNYAIRHVE